MTGPPLNGRLKSRSERGGGGGRRTGGNGGRGAAVAGRVKDTAAPRRETGQVRTPYLSIIASMATASRHAPPQQRAFERRQGGGDAAPSTPATCSQSRPRRSRAGHRRRSRHRRRRPVVRMNALDNDRITTTTFAIHRRLPKKASSTRRTRANYYDVAGEWRQWPATAGDDTCDSPARAPPDIRCDIDLVGRGPDGRRR